MNQQFQEKMLELQYELFYMDPLVEQAVLDACAKVDRNAWKVYAAVISGLILLTLLGIA